MRQIIYKITFLAALLLTNACGTKEAKGTASENEQTSANDDRIFVSKAQFDTGKMELGTLEEKEFHNVVKAIGMIDVPPENKAIINAIMGGFIKTTPLLIGNQVKKGQQLVTIENPEFITMQQEYMEIKQQLNYLKSEYERQKTMVEENITSQKSFLKAESEYQTAMASANGLKQQLSLLNISVSAVEKGNITSIVTLYSPISGSITKVNVARGTFVAPGAPIMEIIDNDHLHLELSVFEKDIMQVKKGQEIRFTIPEASEKVFEADVYLIGTIIENNRTVNVHGHLKNESETNFLVGMFVESSIFTSSQLKKALPETTLVDIDGVYHALQLDEANENGYYFTRVTVKAEDNYNGFSSFLDSEKFENTQFLTKGAFKLLGGE
jgi:cobalt-zinc-cadmium efflux system membrane fusion protein